MAISSGMVGVWMAVVAVAMGGCAGDSTQVVAALQTRQGAVARLEVQATSSISTNPAPPLHVNLTDAGAARIIYASTLALPPMPSGVFSCPADFGIVDYLTFFDGAGVIMLTADAHPAGCQDVRVSGGGDSAVLWASTSPTYWSDLASGLGVAESDLRPSPPTR